MVKIQHLYDFLLDELADCRDRKVDLRVFAEQGATQSYPGHANQSFKLRYTGVIIFANCTYNASHLSYLLLKWLQKHQDPWPGTEPLKWDAEIVSASLTDIVFTMALEEKIMVSDQNGKIKLTTADNFVIDSEIEGNLDLRIEHDPTGPEHE